jgi:hypothetical protein
MKRIFRRNVVAAAVLGAVALSGTALAVDEVEPNNPIQSAQQLIIPPSGSITVNGVIGRVSTGPLIQDADFYSFQGKAGSVISIDIDGGIGGARSVDTWVGIFGPGPDYILKAWNNDVPSGQPLDDGSTSPKDSRIDNFRLDSDGIWTVGVSSFPRALGNQGLYTNTQFRGVNDNGDYILTISVVAPPVQQINIEVKPGSGDLAPANPKARGTIPVALLSSPEFNALDIKRDAKNLTFGSTGDEQSLRRCGKDGEDVDGDGRLDLVCHFDNQLANFADDEDRGTVRGTTNDGKRFEGHGMLKVVPVKHDE